MTNATTTNTTTLIRPEGWAQNLALVFAATLLLTLSAKISVPFYPVPMTMQSFVVVFLGFAMGPRLGGLAVLAYLAEGAVGLPVFSGTPAKGIGLGYMLGTTGGYLIGFLCAVLVTGYLANRHWGRSYPLTALAGFIGLAAIFAPGILWLGAVAGWDKPILAWGLWPFLPGEALKLALLVCIVPLAWRARTTN